MEQSEAGEGFAMQNVEQGINREVRVQEMEEMILRAMDKRKWMPTAKMP